MPVAITDPEAVATVRLLIADEDPDNQVLTDEKIQLLLNAEGGNSKLAAAQAYDIIASSEVLVSKVIKTQDLSTDGAKVAEQLRKHAAALREQVQVEKDDADEGYFDVVDALEPDWTCWP